MLSIQRQAAQIGGDNRVLASVYNGTASTLARGSVVQYDAVACDQFTVTTPLSNQLDLVAGIVADAPQSSPGSTGILTLTCGFIVIYGLATYAAALYAVSQAIAIGDKLVPVAAATYLAYVAAGDGRDGWFAIMSGTAASATTTQKGTVTVMVRAM